jgi:hypothetical protein
MQDQSWVKLRKDNILPRPPMLKLTMQIVLPKREQTRLLKSCLKTALPLATVAVLLTLSLASTARISAQNQPTTAPSSAQVSKAVGTIKSIQVDSITLTSESGGEVTAQLTAATKILKVPPGEKDLKNATPLQSKDLQPGDRVLVRGAANGDAHTVSALSVIVMKQADVAAKQQHDRDEWQKRSVGGLVTKVDPATETITISSAGIAASHSMTVHIAKDTVIRRYAPDSVKFDDAKPASIDQIKTGDQLRALGTRTPDGNEVSAEEVVTGSFRNIAGTIKTIDTAGNTMTVQDAIAKGPVVVKVSPDSQMKKLPAEMAQRIAARLKAAGGNGSGDQPSANGASQNQAAGNKQDNTQRADRTAGTPGSGNESSSGHGPGGNGPPDIQRMLSRLPNSTLADLQKGDAVMIVSTSGADSGAVTAITLLAGVDAILTAAPNRSVSSLLSPWSLGASSGEGEAGP